MPKECSGGRFAGRRDLQLQSFRGSPGVASVSRQRDQGETRRGYPSTGAQIRVRGWNRGENRFERFQYRRPVGIRHRICKKNSTNTSGILFNWSVDLTTAPYVTYSHIDFEPDWPEGIVEKVLRRPLVLFGK